MTAEKTFANFRGYFLGYLEMQRFSAGKTYEQETTRAVGRLVAQMYRQSLKLLCDLPQQQRDDLPLIDASPEGVLALELLRANARDVLKARMLEDKLRASRDQVARLKGSGVYRAARSFRRLFKRGV